MLDFRTDKPENMGQVSGCVDLYECLSEREKKNPEREGQIERERERGIDAEREMNREKETGGGVRDR